MFFGLSFGEICVLVIVSIVVIGPKDMPKVLRKAGQWANKLRRLATDVRTQSGIDEVLRAGGLHDDLNEIRKLAQADFLSPIARPAPYLNATANGTGYGAAQPDFQETSVSREREYPREGADSYGATPDLAVLYARNVAPSPLARDALYIVGDADAVLPPEPAQPLESPQPPQPPAPAERARVDHVLGPPGATDLATATTLVAVPVPERKEAAS